MLGALLGGLFGLADSAMSSSMGFYNQQALAQQQYQYQRQLAQQQASLNENLWYKQFNAYNNYNDPSAVRQRLAAAGLNPALAMSGGAAAAPQSSGSFSSTGVGQGQSMIPGASFAPSGLADSMQAFAGAQKNLEQAQTEETVRALNTANSQLAQAGVITEGARAAGLAIENFIKDATKIENINRSVLENNLLKTQADNVLKQIDVYNSQIDYTKVRSDNERDVAKSTVQMQTSQALLNVARIRFEGQMTAIQAKNAEALCNWYAAQASRIAVGQERDEIARDMEKELKKAFNTVVQRNPNLLYEFEKAIYELKSKENNWFRAQNWADFLHKILPGMTIPIPIG